MLLGHTRLIVAPKCNDNDCTEYIYKHDINSFVIQDFTMEFYDDFKLTNYAVGKFEGKSSNNWTNFKLKMKDFNLQAI